MTGDATDSTGTDGQHAPIPGPTGHPDTCLVLLRGNSGSGKTTIARTVRDRYGPLMANYRWSTSQQQERGSRTDA